MVESEDKILLRFIGRVRIKWVGGLLEVVLKSKVLRMKGGNLFSCGGVRGRL